LKWSRCRWSSRCVSSLVARDLQGLGELLLVLARLQVPADPPEAVPQEEAAQDDAEDRGAAHQTRGPGRVRGGGRVVGAGAGQLVPKQAVQVGVDRGVGGHQPGVVRLGRQLGGAEQVADRRPLPGEQLDVGALGRRVARVHPLLRHLWRNSRCS